MGWRWLLAFSGGIVLSALVPALPPTVGLIAIAGLALLLLLWSKTRLPAVFLLGALWFLVQAQWQLQQQWPESRAGEIIELDLRVATLPEWRGDSIRFIGSPVDESYEMPGRFMVRWFRPSGYIQPGQHWRVKVRVLPPRGRLNFNSFDYTRYLLSQRVGALATVRDAQLIAASSGPRGLVNQSRQYLAEVLMAESRSQRAAGLMRALAIADRSAIDDETRELLAVTGTAHLLAISGLHVGMIAMLAGALASMLAGPLMLVFHRLDRRRFALVVALLAALGYAVLAGLTLPTQRALIMLTVVAMAFLVRRGLQPGHALLVAFSSVLLLDPLSVLATGFWMSFAAVAVLIWTFAWRPNRGSGIGFWLLGLLRAQLMIGVGLVAINAGLFSQVHWLGFPANLLAIPLVGFWVLPSLLMTLLMIALDWPASVFIWLCEAGLEVLLNYLDWLDSIGPSALARPPISFFAMIIGALGSFWLIAPPGWPARWLGAVLLLPVFWSGVSETVPPDELEVNMLDVGQGEAIVIGADGAWILFDSGPGDGEGQDSLAQVLPGVLAVRGQTELDQAIISSAHEGRAGGVATAREWLSEAEIYSSAPGIGQACEAGQSWQIGQLELRLLHPTRGLPDLGANSSCVLHVQSPAGSVLLTGRIDATVERRLLEMTENLEADVLVLADGGHRRATSGEFLSKLKPAVALASVSRHDRFGRPHHQVLERLSAQAVEFQSTGQCGGIRLRLRPEQDSHLVTAVGQSQRFWHAGTTCP